MSFSKNILILMFNLWFAFPLCGMHEIDQKIETKIVKEAGHSKELLARDAQFYTRFSDKIYKDFSEFVPKYSSEVILEGQCNYTAAYLIGMVMGKGDETIAKAIGSKEKSPLIKDEFKGSFDDFMKVGDDGIYRTKLAQQLLTVSEPEHVLFYVSVCDDNERMHAYVILKRSDGKTAFGRIAQSHAGGIFNLQQWLALKQEFPKENKYYSFYQAFGQGQILDLDQVKDFVKKPQLTAMQDNDQIRVIRFKIPGWWDVAA